MISTGANLVTELHKLRVIHYPDQRLRRVSAPITDFGPALAGFAERLKQLMEQGQGVGLAAPQVGVNLRVIVANPTGQPEDARVYVNPKIDQQGTPADAEEGCLSLPGVHVAVRRPQTCRVRAQDLEGRPFEAVLEGLLARIVQHETDHLDGVLIIDRMGPSDQIATRKTLRALEAQSRGNGR